MMEDEFKDDRFLARWLNNELSQEELDAFKQREDYGLYQKLVLGAESIEPADFNKENLLLRIKQGRAEEKTKDANRSWWIYSAAASLFVVFSFVIYSVFFSQTETLILSAIGEQKTHVLPDGSIATLNANSSIAYIEKTWDEERLVRLKGEAFFKVAKGSDFVVESNSGSVTVLGTEFNILDLKDFYEVVCYEGRVQVTSVGDKVILNPSDGVQLIDEKLVARNFESSAPTWIDKRSTFTQVPIKVVLESLKNQYGISYEGLDKVPDFSYSGGFPHDNLDVAIKLVLGSVDVKYRIQNKLVIIGD